MDTKATAIIHTEVKIEAISLNIVITSVENEQNQIAPISCAGWCSGGHGGDAIGPSPTLNVFVFGPGRHLLPCLDTRSDRTTRLILPADIVNANCQTVNTVFVLQSAHLEARDRHLSTGEKSRRLPSNSQLELSLPSRSPRYIST